MTASIAAAMHQTSKLTASSVAAQLERWRVRTDVLPEHTSQVKRLTASVGALLDDAQNRTDDREPGSLALALLRRDGVHATALVWEFFASRLAQRDVPDLEPGLLLADDLAYRVWLPALTAARGADTLAADDVRTPPLTHFGTSPSPVVLPRSAWLPHRSLPDPWDRYFDDAVHSLPVPVIELPCSQSRFLPALVSVAHEAGHVIEDDLGASEALDKLARPIGGPWPGWRYELTADLWGLLGCGAGYLAGLVGALVELGLTAAALPADANPRSHPPAWIRLPVLFALADKIGLAGDAGVAAVRTAWSEVVSSGDVALASLGGADDMVEVLTAPWPSLGDKAPHQVLIPPQTSDVEAVAANVLLGKAVADPRRMAAGAAWAWFTEPASYATRAEDKLLAAYSAIRKSGVRAPPTSPFESALPDPAAGDAKRVRKLLDRLTKNLEDARA